MSNITMPPSLREPPVFAAQVSSCTLREKPAVEARNLSRKTGYSCRLDVTRISINLKSLEVTRNNLDVNNSRVNYFCIFLVLNE